MSAVFWDAALFALSVTMPSVLLLVLGWFLRRTDQVDARFVDQASKLVFRYSMPALLFFSIYANETDYSAQIPLLLAGAVASLLLFVGAEIIAARTVKAPADRGFLIASLRRMPALTSSPPRSARGRSPS